MKYIRILLRLLVTFSLLSPLLGCAESQVEDSTHSPYDSLFPSERTCIHQFRYRDFDITEEQDIIRADLAVCNICGIEIPVHLHDTSVQSIYDTNVGEHEHFYVQGTTSLQTIIEPEGLNRQSPCVHREHTYYLYTCAICNDSFKVYHYTSNIEYCTYPDTPVLDFHIPDEYLHVLVFQCDVCHGYIHSEMFCWLYEKTNHVPYMCEVIWKMHSE